jgi:hypothetical protein
MQARKTLLLGLLVLAAVPRCTKSLRFVTGGGEADDAVSVGNRRKESTRACVSGPASVSAQLAAFRERQMLPALHLSLRLYLGSDMKGALRHE